VITPGERPLWVKSGHSGGELCLNATSGFEQAASGGKSGTVRFGSAVNFSIGSGVLHSHRFAGDASNFLLESHNSTNMWEKFRHF
jgi:hypothetical protein